MIIKRYHGRCELLADIKMPNVLTAVSSDEHVSVDETHMWLMQVIGLAGFHVSTYLSSTAGATLI
jgi:hypothetical protein